MTSRLNPVNETRREQSLDTLRGFAIVGVLFALFLAWDNFGYPTGDESTASFSIIDRAAKIFLHGNAYNLLAFLFGYGFALQVSRAKEKGIDLFQFALRRALGLFLLGTVHAILLRDGDILAPYAICSLFIIILRNAGDKIILLAIVLMLFIHPIYLLILKWAGLQPVPWKQVDVKGTGLISKNIAYLIQHWYPHFFDIHKFTLLMFLIGMYGSRKQWLEKIQYDQKQLIILFFVGVIFYVSYFLIPWKKLFPHSESFNTPDFSKSLPIYALKSVIRFPLRLGIDIAYVALILFLLSKNSTKRMLQPLTNIGKMALTNYLLPDIFFIPLYVILNLWSNVPALQQLIMASSFAVFLGWFSTWWLGRYNFGPFEWLLRSFTYWEWQPFRKKTMKSSIELAA